MKARNVVSLIASVMLAASALAACSTPSKTSSSTGSTETKEKKTLVYWAQWSENETQATVLKSAIERFQAANKDYTVKVNWGGREVSKILKASLDSGTQIDIVEGSHDFIPSQIGPNYLINLDQYVKGTDFEGTILPAMKLFAQSFSPDHQSWYYIPEQPFVGAIFYNKDIFTKAGVTTLPTTWDEFLTCCQKIKDAGYAPMTIDDAYVSTLYGQYLALMKGQDWVGDLMTDKTGKMWSDPAVLQMAKAWQDFAKKGYFSKTVGSNVFPAAQNGELAVGTAAMYFNGSWLPNEVSKTTGPNFNWGVMYLPGVPNAQNKYTTSMNGCQMFAVTKTCKYPEAAAALVKEFLSTKTQQDFVDIAKCIPVVKGCTWPKALKDVETMYNTSTGTILWEGMPKQDKDIKPIVNATFSKLIGGSITAEQFVSELQSQIK